MTSRAAMLVTANCGSQASDRTTFQPPAAKSKWARPVAFQSLAASSIFALSAGAKPWIATWMGSMLLGAAAAAGGGASAVLGAQATGRASSTNEATRERAVQPDERGTIFPLI